MRTTPEPIHVLMSVCALAAGVSPFSRTSAVSRAHLRGGEPTPSRCMCVLGGEPMHSVAAPMWEGVSPASRCEAHPSVRPRACGGAPQRARASRQHSLRGSALSRNLRTFPVGLHKRIRYQRCSHIAGFTGTVSTLTVSGTIRRACSCAGAPVDSKPLPCRSVCMCARARVRACVLGSFGGYGCVCAHVSACVLAKV